MVQSWDYSLLLSLIVIALLSSHSLRFLKLVFHEIRSSSLPRYKHSLRPSWALVTGASDGIGYGFVTELASQGFNVIMHGRNKNKIDQLIEKFQREYPDRCFRSLIVDASHREDWYNLDDFARELLHEKLNLTVLINNVGGGKMKDNFAFVSTDAPSATAVNEMVDLNAIFPVQVTRAVLPILKSNQPSLVINIGSVTGTMAFPYLGPYGASKSFVSIWSNSLRLEMIKDGLDIEVFSVQTGKVQSPGTRMTPMTLFVPSSRQFAASTLRKVGTGEACVYGFWGHAIQIELLALIPGVLRDRFMINLTKKEIELERKQS